MKKNKWEAVAHDYNSPWLRNSIWVGCFLDYQKLFHAPIPRFGIISNRNDIEYIADIDSWKKTHEALKKKAIKDYRFVERLIDFTHGYGEKMNQWSEKNIYKTNFTRLTAKKLIQLLSKFNIMQARQYSYGCAVPILDFQDFSFVEKNLKDYLEKKVSQNEYSEFLAVFTEPTKSSFAQNQEEDLLKLMSRYYLKKGWQAAIRKKSIAYLKKTQPRFYKDLKTHTDKYCWVYYVYNGPAYTEENFLEFIYDYLKKRIIPQVELKKISRHKEDLAIRRKKYIRRLKPDKFHSAILKLAGKIVWGKPRRKDYQSRTYYHANKLFQEIARRLHLSLDQVKATPFSMIKRGLLKNKPIDVNVVNQINDFHVVLPDKVIKPLYGRAARYFSAKNVKRMKKSKISMRLSRITGSCAYGGKVEGMTKLINTVHDMKKMNYGDILISNATTPSLIPAMKKAAGFVTDEGGLTCHAAIVAREMKKPCVIGTKIATRVFKDGDRVEVDADRGVVRRI